MRDNLPIKLHLDEKTQKIQIVCAETGRFIGNQFNTKITSDCDNLTVAVISFNILKPDE